MTQFNRANLLVDIASFIKTNGIGAITGIIHQARLNNVVDSALNIITDKDVNGGYLGIDLTNGNIDESFIRKVTPTGQVLDDSGNWVNQTAATTILYGQTVYLDQTNGNNGTGARGDISKPFKDIGDAKAAAISGDLVKIAAGTYPITDNFAKNGVCWRGDGNVFITYTGFAGMYDTGGGGFTLPSSLLGSGITLTKSGSPGPCLDIGDVNSQFHVHDLISNGVGATAVVFDNGKCVLTFNEIFNDSAAAMTGTPDNCIITGTRIKSTASKAIDFSSGSSNTIVTCPDVESTTSTAYKSTGLNNRLIGARIVGVGGYGIDIGGGTNHVSGTVNGIKMTAGQLRFSGGIEGSISLIGNAQLYAPDANLTGDVVFGGQFAYASFNASNSVGTITIQGGTCDVHFYGFPAGGGGEAKIDLQAGICNLTGSMTSTSTTGTPILMSGGRLNTKGLKLHLANQTVFGIITGGTLDLSGSSLFDIDGSRGNLAVDDIGTIFSIDSGVELICDDVTFIGQFPLCSPIVSRGAKRNLRVKAGIWSTGTTGSILAARKRMHKLTITATGVSTGITINDQTGSETFTEADFGTYNTKALMAEQMKDLINNSATLDVLAVYVASDEFFTVEGTTEGILYVLTSLSNLGFEIKQEASYGFTPLLGGSITEDADVL